MKIDNARGILAAKKMYDEERGAEDSAEACQLGIEALKREQTFRGRVPESDWSLLPGETKE